jgi:N-acetylneuraminate synthase
MSDIQIEKHLIGPGHAPFVIAEMSGNHNQSLDRALAIVEAAAEAGAHALKLQTYTADTMTINIDTGEFFIDDPNSLWKGESLYRLYQRAYTPWEWHLPIFKRCRELGLVFLSTPFDATAVDFLEELNVPCYKIASFENIDLPLIRRVAATGKPVILSTGMATVAELDETVRAARQAGCRELVLLKCTSSYPSDPKYSNLLTIPHLQKLFDCQVGLSDHTLGIGVAIASVALGATVVEKHFTLRREDGGVDADFSLEPVELASMVTETRRAVQALGEVCYGITEQEKRSRLHRRSLYIVKDIAEGEVLTAKNLRSIRPGLGIAPKYMDLVLGKRVKYPMQRGTPLSWDDLI